MGDLSPVVNTSANIEGVKKFLQDDISYMVLNCEDGKKLHSAV